MPEGPYELVNRGVVSAAADAGVPKPTSMNRRTLIAAWAALCVGGLAATSALNASPTPE
ncbi:hypothetical protein ACFV9W_33400 [Streptomyces sp. NPDC059897]|uniref:hypothetical protein n=1 Tax=Streptomyces sp. NPDC059897 TaxID=3346994 RepID=UPI0036528F74